MEINLCQECILDNQGFPSACGPFTKTEERIQKFKQTGDSRCIYRNELDKVCFQHDMAYGDFKDLKRRTAADNVLRDKAFNIDKNPRYDGYQRGLASMVYKLFDKKTKPVIRKFKRMEVYSAFKDYIWAANLADMQLISKFNKEFIFLLCVIDIYSKYAWVVPLKDKKGIRIVNAFQSILNKSNRKPNKIWIDKGSEFYNRSMKSWLEKNDIEQQYVRTTKNKIYRHMTSISKNVYIDKLDDIVNEYNNTKHRTAKVKPIDVKDNTYIDFW